MAMPQITTRSRGCIKPIVVSMLLKFERTPRAASKSLMGLTIVLLSASRAVGVVEPCVPAGKSEESLKQSKSPLQGAATAKDAAIAGRQSCT
ncbi:hypothetical protein T440DRAFT_463907 [Plenodomus tracheiphilus IPT5]|uniref:Uncharacterized protein n=1 Tax=Plenodomus tracheiphilus IPT5 TaxID=1408161 RepID=A0A6A7BJN5_9PLEO|nr:hypothetical protein T440DRAFT_463907 [Plenodomus tracheiphilus IPT5]